MVLIDRAENVTLLMGIRRNGPRQMLRQGVSRPGSVRPATVVNGLYPADSGFGLTQYALTGEHRGVTVGWSQRHDDTGRTRRLGPRTRFEARAGRGTLEGGFGTRWDKRENRAVLFVGASH